MSHFRTNHTPRLPPTARVALRITCVVIYCLISLHLKTRLINSVTACPDNGLCITRGIVILVVLVLVM